MRDILQQGVIITYSNLSESSKKVTAVTFLLLFILYHSYVAGLQRDLDRSPLREGRAPAHQQVRCPASIFERRFLFQSTDCFYKLFSAVKLMFK